MVAYCVLLTVTVVFAGLNCCGVKIPTNGCTSIRNRILNSHIAQDQTSNIAPPSDHSITRPLDLFVTPALESLVIPALDHFINPALTYQNVLQIGQSTTTERIHQTLGDELNICRTNPFL